MDGLLFLAILIAAARYAIREGQKAADKQKTKQRQTQWQQAHKAEQPRQAAQHRHYHPAFEGEEVQPVTMQGLMRQARSAAGAVKDRVTQHRPAGSMAYDSSEGEGHIDGDYRFEELTPRSDDHVVKPFTETKHVHTESTIMGAEVCEPAEKDVYEMPSAIVSEAEMSDIRKAIIWSEIIGKPRALRR
ncbi:MAG: hypothetical protein IJB30_04410 [Clostridia bacterium]|nr:hypothetical protein [Clostridia bacterium]